MNRVTARVILVAGAIVGVLMVAGPASAHPLGNFTVNTYSGITVTPDRLEIEYVLDLAEIPTLQERSGLDADRDGVVESEEAQSWAGDRADDLAGGLQVALDGRPLDLAMDTASVELAPGQAGLDVLRLEATYTASVDGGGRIEFRDRNYAALVGWHEVTAVGSGGIAVSRSSVPTTSVSSELRAYPEGLLSSPLDVRQAAFDFAPGEQTTGGVSPAASEDRPGIEDSPLASLVSRPDLSVGVVMVALGAAFATGALHALAPGHGKTVTTAYLAGTATRTRHAVGAGIAVAVMHTASVVAVGLVVLLLARTFPAERIYPWLTVAAGAAAVALGGTLLWRRLRHSHSNHHDHKPPLSRGGIAALAASGGLLPSPTAIVVLLGAVSLGRTAFGVSLIAAFGLGLAAALIAVGVAAVRLRDLMARRAQRIAAFLPIAGAAAILVVGLVVATTGVVRL